jgi:hypothetical protein
MGVDFTYFTIMTTIIRLHPDFPTDQYIKGDCLENARRSLYELKNMEQHGMKCSEYRNAYCLSVAWLVYWANETPTHLHFQFHHLTFRIPFRIVLLYPLCPFFTLFCHVIETLDKADFRLLGEVADGLTMFAEANIAVGHVKELCSMLVSLCKAHIESLEEL